MAAAQLRSSADLTQTAHKLHHRSAYEQGTLRRQWTSIAAAYHNRLLKRTRPYCPPASISHQERRICSGNASAKPRKAATGTCGPQSAQPLYQLVQCCFCSTLPSSTASESFVTARRTAPASAAPTISALCLALTFEHAPSVAGWRMPAFAISVTSDASDFGDR